MLDLQVLTPRAKHCLRCATNKPEHEFPEKPFDEAGDKAEWTQDEDLIICRKCLHERVNNKILLAGNEGIMREKSITDLELEHQRMPDQHKRADYKNRRGRVLHCNEFISRLRQVVPSLETGLIVRDGYMGVGLYLVKKDQTLDFVGGLHIHSPEFEILRLNKRRLIRGTIRGWRTILIRLFIKGAITEAQHDEAFGLPSAGGADLYQKEMYLARHARLGLPVQKGLRGEIA